MSLRSSKLTRFVSLCALAVIAPCGVALAQTAGQSFVIAESGPFRLVATPEVAPVGLLSTTISLETVDTNHRIVTLDNVAITVGLRKGQTWWGFARVRLVIRDSGLHTG